MVTYDDCATRTTPRATCSPIADTVNRIRALKADRAGDGRRDHRPAPPYVVDWKSPATTDTSCGAASCPWPMIAHSCTAADSSFADPAVRIGEMVDHFGANGRMISICDGEFSGALADIGSDVLNYVSAPCIMGRIAKKSGTTHDDCTVVDNATGQTIPDCADTSQAGRCWSLVPSATNTCSGVTVSIQGSAGPQDTTVDCQLCAAGVSAPTRGCP